MKAETIFYTLGDALYVNLTNRCPCQCAFCVRTHGDGVGDADSLWLEHEPSLEEALEAVKQYDLTAYREVVFCGYGEPMIRLEVLCGLCRYLREHSSLPIRINTNGLSDLIHGKPTAACLKGLADTVSISLNAPTAADYNALCKPAFGERAFQAILDFAKDCKTVVPEVILSVVDVIPLQQIEACKELARQMEIPLRVREYWN